MRRALATVGAAVIVALGAGPAVASHTPDDRNCSDFESPIVIINGYDPAHLDADGNGIGCQNNPGEPVKTDLYADLRGEDELAETGIGPAEHPIRWMAAGAALIVGGAGAVVVGRRRKETL